MKRVFAVARREYLERVRSKAFLVSTILGPTLLAAFMIAPIALSRQRGRPLHVAVLDASDALGADAEPLGTTLGMGVGDGAGA